MASFAGNRYASFSDLQTPEWAALFGELEGFSQPFVAAFLEAVAPDYTWPPDPLHFRFRPWEYPYALGALRQLRGSGLAGLKVLDIGSALTFFPAFLMQQGMGVVASDFDPAMEGRFAQFWPHYSPGAPPRYVTQDAGELALFQDGTFDVITCISVLEHVPNFERVPPELHRVLKPGGQLIVTLDLASNDMPQESLDAPSFNRLLELLEDRFLPALPWVPCHPMDVMQSYHWRRTPQLMELCARAQGAVWQQQQQKLRPHRKLHQKLQASLTRAVQRKPRPVHCVVGAAFTRR